MKLLQHYWYHPNYWIWLLLPVSWLYCSITIIRRKLYQLNIKKSYQSKVPIVVIGNIVAGGSGKTPLLISLCEYFQKKGYRPGVVSRGYGGNFSGVQQVSTDDSAARVGDEPLMIHQRTGVPVVVGADRVAAVEHLVNNTHCDIVLSDDGLQHYRMQRDFEIAVIDATRKFGNGFCLPAGPLRERLTRLDEVDMQVYNTSDPDMTGSEVVDECYYKLQFVSLNSLNDNDKSRPLSSFLQQPVHAVAGIGNPSRFFQQLSEEGFDTTNHIFPDHYVFTQDDFSGWQQECIIMTEKDAVKCRHLFLSDAWVMIVRAVFSEALELRLSSDLLPLVNR